MRRFLVVSATLLALLALMAVPATAGVGGAGTNANIAAPVRPDHAVYCNLRAVSPWRSGSTIYGQANYSCNAAPDVVLFCAQLEVFLEDWEPAGPETCTSRALSSNVLTPHAPAHRGRWEYRTRADLSIFHGNWSDSQATAYSTITY